MASQDVQASKPKKLVSRADLARIAGVTPACVTQRCRVHLAPACSSGLVDLDHPLVAAWLGELRANGRKPTAVGTTRKIARSGDASSHRSSRRPSAGTAKQPARAPTKTPGKPPKRPAHTDPSSTNPRGAGRKPRTWSPADRPEEEQDDSAPKLDDAGLAEEILDLTVREVAERYGTHRSYVLWLEAYQKQQATEKIRLSNEETKGNLISRELVRDHIFAAIDALFRRLLTDAARTIAARLEPMAKSGSSPEALERETREQLSKQLKAIKSRASRVLKSATNPP